MDQVLFFLVNVTELKREEMPLLRAGFCNADVTQQSVRYGMPTSFERRAMPWASFDGKRHKPKPNRLMLAADVCSVMATTFAPFDFKYSAIASSNAPVPATTIRLFSTFSPPLTRACNPPAPSTFGSVQPGKGKYLSRAPVAITSF